MIDDAARETRARVGATGVQVEAQAKINLRLKILAREASGFHQLETLFLRLTLADRVRVRHTDGARTLDVSISADVEPAALGPTERNLAWRAATAYADAAGWPHGFAIELEKRIPVGGGLGGGSADAAAVLRCLDAIAPRPLGGAALRQLAITLGADVPFLASQATYALAWGRGERLLALAPPSRRDVVLLVPNFGVSTAEAYGWLSAARAAGPPAATASDVLDPSDLSRWDRIVSLAVNDFEPVVSARHPAIAALVRALSTSGCAPALMSGSGSVVVGIRPEGAGASAIGSDVPCRTVVTSTATRVEPVERLD